MIEKREKEWQELESKARQMLENPRLLPKDETTKHFAPILHLWISPTFTPEKHWVFYKPRPQINPPPKPFVRQMIWQKQTDFKRLNDPLIGLKKAFRPRRPLKQKQLKSSRKYLKIFIINCPKFGFRLLRKMKFSGLTAKDSALKFSDFIILQKFRWWSVYPKEWQKLVAWFEKTEEFLEENFK